MGGWWKLSRIRISRAVFGVNASARFFSDPGEVN
jgi:hypothetical protein